jgi:dihydroorotase
MGVALVVAHARWLERSGSFAEGHVLVVDGTIRLLPLDRDPPEGVPRLDGRGLILLPGVVDSHTHFRQPGQAYKEGIARGSRAALKGGVTTVLDMPNNRPPCTTEPRLSRKRELFSRLSLVNWGLHAMASPGKAPPVSAWASGKIYMARASAIGAVRGADEIGTIFARWRRVTVHAEDEAAFLPVASPPRPHHEERPRSAVTRALRTLETVLEHAGHVRLIICHVSTADEVHWIRRQKARGFDVWGETCPHYCLLTQDDYLAHGARLQVNPPLRTGADRAAILEGLADGTIDFISSDHAPHTPEEKAGPRPPSGIPGIEWTVPLLMHLVDGGLSWRRFHAAACAAASSCFGIGGRDGIVPANVADMVVVGPAGPRSDDRIYTRAGYAPYGHLGLRWEVRATFVNGHVMYREGAVVGSAPGREVVS